jgi:hypothetical protein
MVTLLAPILIPIYGDFLCAALLEHPDDKLQCHRFFSRDSLPPFAGVCVLKLRAACEPT